MTYLADYLNAITGTELDEERAAWRRMCPVQILDQGAVAIPHTGDTAEFVDVTVTIPAGTMGANDALEVTTLWSFSSSTNSKAFKVRLGGTGGTQYLNASRNTTGEITAQMVQIIRNRNSVSSQVGYAFGATASYGVSTGSIVTSSVNMANAQDLVISCQLANSGETITLEAYSVKLVRAPA